MSRQAAPITFGRFYDNVRTAEIKLQYVVYSLTEQKRMLAAADAVVYCAGSIKQPKVKISTVRSRCPKISPNEIVAAAAPESQSRPSLLCMSAEA